MKAKQIHSMKRKRLWDKMEIWFPTGLLILLPILFVVGFLVAPGDRSSDNGSSPLPSTARVRISTQGFKSRTQLEFYIDEAIAGNAGEAEANFARLVSRGRAKLIAAGEYEVTDESEARFGPVRINVDGESWWIASR